MYIRRKNFVKYLLINCVRVERALIQTLTETQLKMLWLLQFRVSGKNLSGVCKLVFKVSRCDKNDKLFLEDNILGMYQVIIPNHIGYIVNKPALR